jgi:hypothetical protein
MRNHPGTATTGGGTGTRDQAARRHDDPAGVASSRRTSSTSVPADGDRIESPDGSQGQVVGGPGLRSPTGGH